MQLYTVILTAQKATFTVCADVWQPADIGCSHLIPIFKENKTKN